MSSDVERGPTGASDTAAEPFSFVSSGAAPSAEPSRSGGLPGSIAAGAVGFLAHPVTQTFGFLLAGYGAYALLSQGQGEDAFADSYPWTVWKVTVSIGIAMALTLGAHGVATLVRIVKDPDYRTEKGPAIWYCGMALVLVAGVGYFLSTIPQSASGGYWLIDNMGTRLTLVAAVASIPAAPWIALVWIAHCGERAATQEADNTSQKLDHRWQLIVACAQSFALFVVVALIPTGALRAAYLAQAPDDKSLENAFPASNVLAYGAFYAVLIVVIIVPLVAAWRGRAQWHVNKMFPLDGTTNDEWEAGRARLEKLHNLDVSLLRNPLTGLSVFAPLVTATLAYFLPQLGS